MRAPGYGWGQVLLAVGCLTASALESCAGRVIALAPRRIARFSIRPA